MRALCTDVCRNRITCTITRTTVFYQQIENGNIANQIHGFTIDYGKFILIPNIVHLPVLLFLDLPDPVKKVSLGVSDLAKSLVYWQKLLGMTVYEQSETEALLGYDSDKCKLELIHLGCPVDHATAFGRIAFSCPSNQLPGIEHSVKEAGHAILTPLVSLDTPGKATVQVVILTDPVISL